MSNVLSRHNRRHAGFTALVIALALVAVPTIMRARQHVELHDTTRLSIKLNWQSATPPQRAMLAPDDAVSGAVVPSALAQQPHAARVTPRVHAFDEPVTQPLLDNAPDLLRGPPAPLSPGRIASVAV